LEWQGDKKMKTKNKSQDSSTRKDEQKNDSDSHFSSEYPDNDYPVNADEYLELSFPKGDKKRGHAMVILAIAFMEGQEKAKMKFEKMLVQEKFWFQKTKLGDEK
jgi:hypothetical protein